MPKFFIKTLKADRIIRISGSDAHHINVMRYRTGDEIIISNGGGTEYICRIVSIKKDEVAAEVLEEGPALGEPGFFLSLFQGLPKADKMEMIIQKTVELGVFEIIPIITARSVADLGEKKLERWQKISEAAAKQCRRGIIPRVNAPISLAEAVMGLDGFDEAYAGYELEKNLQAASAFSASKGKRVAMFIGPEGGFEESEAILLQSARAVTFSLGKRILRTETASIAAVAGLMLLREE